MTTKEVVPHQMSQQGAAGRGRGCGRSRGKSRYYPQGGVDATKAFKSTISKIAEDTFNTGQKKFATQFTQSRMNVSNYLQRTLAYEGYLVAETVCTGKKQIIELPPTVDESAAVAEDQKIIRAKEVKTVVKRRLKLGEALKKGYATVYDQCSQKVRDKLESTNDWDKTQKEQSLEELIRKIECICVGFDDHKQEVFKPRTGREDTLPLHPRRKGERRGIREKLQEPVGNHGDIQRLPRHA